MNNKPITTEGFCPIQKKKYNINITYEKDPDSDTYTAKSFYCDNFANCRLDECLYLLYHLDYILVLLVVPSF